MPEITTSLQTNSASKYLQQLCKHFAHKVPATFDVHTAEVTFEPGTCRMKANADTLFITLEGKTEEDLQRLIYIVESHLIRFAWREDIDLDWTNDNGALVPKSTKVVDMLAPQREKFAGKRRD